MLIFLFDLGIITRQLITYCLIFQFIDVVWVNSGDYQDVFCPGQTNCNGYSDDDDDIEKVNRDLNGLLVALSFLQAVGIATLVYFQCQKSALSSATYRS